MDGKQAYWSVCVRVYMYIHNVVVGSWEEIKYVHFWENVHFLEKIHKAPNYIYNTMRINTALRFKITIKF